MAKRVGGQGSARTPLGELTTLPQTPSRLGRGHSSPDPTPLSAFGASNFAPSVLNFGVPIVVNLRNDHWLKPFQ